MGHPTEVDIIVAGGGPAGKYPSLPMYTRNSSYRLLQDVSLRAVWRTPILT